MSVHKREWVALAAEKEAKYAERGEATTKELTHTSTLEESEAIVTNNDLEK